MPDGGEDQEADEHPHGATHEGFSATVVLDEVETDEGDLVQSVPMVATKDRR